MNNLLRTVYGIKTDNPNIIKDYNVIGEALEKGLLNKTDLQNFILLRFSNFNYDTDFLVEKYLLKNIYNENIKYINREDYRYYLSLLKDDIKKSFSFMSNIDRNKIEEDPVKLQPIVYMRVLHNNKTVILFRKSFDKRTSNQYDFPAGHISSNDTSYEDAIYRELNEELGLNREDIKSIEYKTHIQPTLEVELSSTYHLGLVFDVILCSSAEVKNAEPDKHDVTYLEYLDFKDVDTLKKIKSWFLKCMIYFNYI